MGTTHRIVTSPDELGRYVRGVKSGDVQSLVIVGRGGTGKSHIVSQYLPPMQRAEGSLGDGSFAGQESMGDSWAGGARWGSGRISVGRFYEELWDDGAAWKSGRLSPVQFYLHLYRNRDRTIVLDDLTNIAKDLALAGLLRQLCETTEVRRVSWDTQNKRFDELGVPTSFETKSRLVLITNRWMDRHEEVQALETRCQIVRYEPSVAALHEMACGFPEGRIEPVVLRYVGDAIKDGRVHRLNLRSYLTASTEYRIGVDWRLALEQDFLPEDVDELETEEEVVRGWCLKSGREDFSVRDVCLGPQRFRGQSDHVSELLKKMAAAGTLVEIPPKPRSGRGPGRPAGSRYKLAT